MKITKNPYYMSKSGRDLLPFKNLKLMSDYLHRVGSKDPPIRVRDFIQDIRRDDTRDQKTGHKKKMSYEYKILAKLCPSYGKKADPIMNRLYPVDAYHYIEESKYLWTRAFVKLVIDERTANDYESILEGYSNAQQDYKRSTLQNSMPEEIEKKKRTYELKRHEKSKFASAVNSRNVKDLGLCLTFRGLLAYLFSEHEYQNEVKREKGKRDAEEAHSEIAGRGRKAKLDSSVERVRQVIRNPNVQKEAVFLKDCELQEYMGFDVVGLLLLISVELIDQLHIDAGKDYYLLRRAMERYLVEFDRFFFGEPFDPERVTHYTNVVCIHPLKGTGPSDKQSSVDVSSNVLRLNDFRGKMAELMSWLILRELDGMCAMVRKSLLMEKSLKVEYDDGNDPSLKVDPPSIHVFSDPIETEPEK